MKDDIKRIGILISVLFCAVILCACPLNIFSKKPEQETETSETTETTVATTASSVTVPSESATSETEAETKPLTDEEALSAFTNYLYFKVKNLQAILDEGKYPCTWGIASSSKNKVMIMYKSHTGALLRYHIDRNSGKTYVTSYSVESNSYYRTKETLNVRDYIDKKPTPTPYVIKPSGKDNAKPTEKPVVKVLNAVDKTSVIGGSKHPYKIPRVSISNKNTESINKKMKSDLSKYATKGSNAREITYSYHISGKLVSILVHITDCKDFHKYKAYNISVASGKQVKNKTVVKLAGWSSSKFLSRVKTTYKNFGGGPSAPATAAAKCVKANKKKATYKYVEPYVAKNGHLCFIGYVYYSGGQGDRVFDATAKKCIA